MQACWPSQRSSGSRDQGCAGQVAAGTFGHHHHLADARWNPDPTRTGWSPSCCAEAQAASRPRNSGRKRRLDRRCLLLCRLRASISLSCSPGLAFFAVICWLIRPWTLKTRRFSMRGNYNGGAGWSLDRHGPADSHDRGHPAYSEAWPGIHRGLPQLDPWYMHEGQQRDPPGRPTCSASSLASKLRRRRRAATWSSRVGLRWDLEMGPPGVPPRSLYLIQDKGWPYHRYTEDGLPGPGQLACIERGRPGQQGRRLCTGELCAPGRADQPASVHRHPAGPQLPAWSATCSGWGGRPVEQQGAITLDMVAGGHHRRLYRLELVSATGADRRYRPLLRPDLSDPYQKQFAQVMAERRRR